MYKLAITIAICAATLGAQSTTTNAAPAPAIHAPNVVEFGPIGITAALAGPTTNIAGAPYSATVETRRVQILADGNRIEQTTTGTVARDSQGRVRRDEALPALEGGEAPHLTFIEDPVAGVHWTLDPRTKVAIKSPFGRLNNSARGTRAIASADTMGPGLPLPPPNGPGQVFFYSSTLPPKADLRVMNLQAEKDTQAITTDLGTQTVEGVPAKGTRYTRTIPAGKIGNQQPIVITTETWYSPDLKITVLSKSNDPRVGETTYELTDLQRAEPPASLFEVPADYTVSEPKANVVFQTAKPQQ